jgi:hypothetical protein
MYFEKGSEGFAVLGDANIRFEFIELVESDFVAFGDHDHVFLLLGGVECAGSPDEGSGESG